MRIDLSAEVTRERVASGFLALLRWWWREMKDLIPSRWREWARSLFERRLVQLEGKVWRIGPGIGAPDGLVLDMAAPDHTLRDLIARVDPSCLSRRFDAVIPETDGLLRRIALPAAAEQRLRAVVGLQLNRLSPFRGEDVRFDCRKAANAENGMMDVDIGIVPKATLLAYEERLRNIGLAVGRFRFAGTGLTLARVGSGWTAHERVQLALAGLAAALWLGAIVLIPISRDLEIDRLSAEVASLRAPAAHASAVRVELIHMRAPVAAASARQAQLDALDALRAVTQLLPSDVQLSSFSLQRDLVRMEGRAEDPDRVVTLLNKSAYFRGAHLTKASSGAQFAIEMGAQPRAPGSGR